MKRRCKQIRGIKTGFDKDQCMTLNSQVDAVNKILVGNSPSNNNSEL